MAWTQADVDALKAAIATGAKKVKYTDREVEFQDTGAMMRALSAMEAEVNAAAGTARYTRLMPRKGFDSCE